MKKIMFLFFLSFKLVFCTETLTTGNGLLAAEVVKSSGGLRVKSKLKSADFAVDSLDIAVAIDGVIHPIKNSLKSVSYVDGTGMVKVVASEEKFDLNLYYVPSMLQKELFYIFVEVDPKLSTGEFELLYYINPGQDIGVLNYYPGGFVYGETRFTYGEGKKLFFSDDNDIFVPKMKMVEGRSKKYTEDRFLILDKLSLKERTVTSTLVLDFSNGAAKVEKWSTEDEVSYWTNWLGVTEYRSNENILKQQLIFLKTMQLENGEVASNHVKNSLETVESTLFAAKAFMRYSFYEEAKKGLSFVLEKAGKKELSSYEEALLAYVVSDYMVDTGDLEFFYNNREAITGTWAFSRMADLASGKISIEGTGEIGTDYYLYVAMENLYSLGIEEFQNYRLPLLDLRVDFNLRYLQGDEVVSQPADTTATEYNLLYIGLLPSKKRDELIKKQMEAYRGDVISWTSEATIDLLGQIYGNRFFGYRDENLLVVLNKLIIKNDFIISEYLNKSGYIDSRIASKYLLMMHDRGI